MGVDGVSQILNLDLGWVKVICAEFGEVTGIIGLVINLLVFRSFRDTSSHETNKKNSSADERRHCVQFEKVETDHRWMQNFLIEASKVYWSLRKRGDWRSYLQSSFKNTTFTSTDFIEFSEYEVISVKSLGPQFQSKGWDPNFQFEIFPLKWWIERLLKCSFLGKGSIK